VQGQGQFDDARLGQVAAVHGTDLDKDVAISLARWSISGGSALQMPCPQTFEHGTLSTPRTRSPASSAGLTRRPRSGEARVWNDVRDLLEVCNLPDGLVCS